MSRLQVSDNNKNEYMFHGQRVEMDFTAHKTTYGEAVSMATCVNMYDVTR